MTSLIGFINKIINNNKHLKKKTRLNNDEINNKNNYIKKMNKFIKVNTMEDLCEYISSGST